MSKLLTLIEENPLILLNGALNYGHEYGKATYHKTVDGIVVLSGVVRSKEYGVIAQLPEGYRPSEKLVFNVNSHSTPARVDILVDGRIMWVNGEIRHCHGHISLAGINFHVGTGKETLPLTNGWVAYGNEYGTPTYVKTSENIVVVSGMVKDGDWSLIAELPVGFRPKKRLSFNVNNNSSTSRIDVLTDGRIIWVSGGRSHAWVSLSGIIFSIDSGESLTAMNGWKGYGDAYGHPTYVKTNDGLIVLSGLIRDGKKGVIAQLPNKCYPQKRLIFNLRSSNTTARVDVLIDGRIIWVSGGSCNADISLSGINFFTEYSYSDSISSGEITVDSIVADNITAININTNDLSANQIDTTHIVSETITNSSTITTQSITCTSDVRNKRDIKVLNSKKYNIDHLKPVEYKFKNSDRLRFGFIAQDIQKTNFKDVVIDSSGNLSVNYMDLIGVLTNEVKILKRRLRLLENKKK